MRYHPSSRLKAWWRGGPGRFDITPHKMETHMRKLVGFMSSQIKYLVDATSPQFKAWCEVTPGRFDITYTQDGNAFAFPGRFDVAPNQIPG